MSQETPDWLAELVGKIDKLFLQAEHLPMVRDAVAEFTAREVDSAEAVEPHDIGHACALLACLHDGVCAQHEELAFVSGWKLIMPEYQESPAREDAIKAVGELEHAKRGIRFVTLFLPDEVDRYSPVVERASDSRLHQALDQVRAWLQANLASSAAASAPDLPEERCAPMTKVEIARRLLDRYKCRSRDADIHALHHGLRKEPGGLYTISLEGLPGGAKRRFQMPGRYHSPD